MAKRELWELPKLRRDEDEERHRRVTWLELFFDLFFVVVIAQLAHKLVADPSLTGVKQFVLLFVPVWWVWIGSTYYIERFETEGLENRLFAFVMMLAVAGMAVSTHAAFGESFPGFVLSYAAARAFTAILWIRAGIHNPPFRPTAIRFGTGFTVAVSLAVWSAFLEGPGRFVVFGSALALDVLTPIVVIRLQEELPKFSTSKLPERFGLFVIVVLGESVVGVVSGLADEHHLTTELCFNAALGVAIGFGLWWIYFDFVGRRPFKKGYWVFAWSYLHLPLVMSIVAVGAGITNLLEHPGELQPSARILIAGAVGVALWTMGFLEMTLRRGRDEPTHPFISPALKLAAGLVAIGVGGLDLFQHANPLLCFLVLLLLVQMVYGAWVWFTQELPEDVS